MRAREMRSHSPVPALPVGQSRRSGFTLIELVIVLTLGSILLALGAPRYHRTLEQAQLDLVVSRLGTMGVAQRLYRLESGGFCGELAALVEARLLTRDLARATTRYEFFVDIADDAGFRIVARRTGSRRWSGQLSIDEQGVVTGSVSDGDVVLTPEILRTSGGGSLDTSGGGT